MNKTNTPFRYDYVGSFLRPAALKQARADFQSGRIDAAALKAVEDDAIRDLVAKQKAAGYHVITDGEFRRATWHLDFMWGFHGVGHTPTKTGLPFQGESAMLDDTYLTGKVSVDEHPFVEHFRFVKALEDENTVAKLTIPAPAQFLEQMVMPFAMENTKRFYPSVQELMDDLAAGYRKVIADVYAVGCRNLQFDDCSWGMLVDPRACMIFDTDAKGLEEIKEQMLTVNNMAIGGKPDDLVINTHVCRGNFHSTYASSGAYDSVAKTLLARENVNAYYLEFDDARSGGFEPLASVSGEKKVVLGLVTTKRPELESKDAVIARIHEAAKYLPLDRLCLSPQCGFASCEIGNKLTEAQQWAKLALVKEIAEEVWGLSKIPLGRPRGQMSESMLTAAFIILSGGLQDAYTYLCRGKVFANAQTGNIVLFSAYLFDGDWTRSRRYLVPVLSFMLGIFVAECVHRRFKHMERVHWRQLILLAEIVLLFLVGFLPQEGNTAANALVSFVCAMQVQTFRKVRGHAYASTMCIGNMRSGTEALCVYFHTHDREVLHKALTYFGVIGLFAVGAGLGALLTRAFAERGIWVSCALLAVSFLIMFIREEEAK